ncbi:PIG-L family deacetylase [Patescibacteria group bacterium]|nr:PIG-L family deacetylase [Patescibacteria group bacterium]MBU1953274.1 PIG-L family deacetylase [Patescibacteria group bacterium]
MKQKNLKKLLIFSAHPDDNLSCAGTALFLKDAGFEISEVVFTGGEKSINLSQNKKTLPKIRKKELADASKILGTKNIYMLGQPDSNVARTTKLLDKVISIIRKEKPTIVISENPNDYHYDHQQVGKIVTEAVERAGWGINPKLGKKHKTPVGLYMGTLIENERSDILVDITKYWNQKIKMMETYGSQLGSGSYDFNEGLAKYFGYYIRVKYAESFEIMKNYAIRLNQLIEILSQ